MKVIEVLFRGQGEKALQLKLQSTGDVGRRADRQVYEMVGKILEPEPHDHSFDPVGLLPGEEGLPYGGGALLHVFGKRHFLLL
jgi:hypothetical protein